MLHFNVLERAVLEDICRYQVDEREVLEGQLATATVTLRKNTGDGFFTYFAVDRSGPPLTNRRRILETSPLQSRASSGRSCLRFSRIKTVTPICLRRRLPGTARSGSIPRLFNSASIQPERERFNID
jgi:hypothetical protein